MTARQVWEGMLTELSKVNAPSMLLADFNYFFNKAINQYINKRYNIYDINQQTTDDLRVLKSTAIIKPQKITDTEHTGILQEFLGYGAGMSRIFGATYEVYLPLDYLHMLNCVCIYRLDEKFKCYNKGDHVQFAAKRLTADSWSTIINDFYNRPLPERPYYYIHNVNTKEDLPTNPIESVDILTRTLSGTDAKEDYTFPVVYVTEYKFSNPRKEEEGQDDYIYETVQEPGEDHVISKFEEEHPDWIVTKTKVEYKGSSNLPRTISIEGLTNKSVVEKEAGQRYGNASSVRCEIRYGHDDSVFKLEGVLIDYIKSPQVIRLTQEQVNLTKDTSQIMEFPDYVCQEIINELTLLVMENTADPRLATNPSVTQSIANPAQAQTPQQTAPRRRQYAAAQE